VEASTYEGCTMSDQVTTSCIGCGYCCKRAMCLMGIDTLGQVEKECPFLQWSTTKNRYLCLLYDTFKSNPMFGGGCSSSLFNTWREDVKER